jgi:hypothetical protein
MTEKELDRFAEVEEAIGHRESPGFHMSAIENMSEAVSIFQVAKRHTNTMHDKVDGSFRRSIHLSNLVPTPVSDRDCASFVLRATQLGLLDTVYAMVVISNCTGDLREAKISIRGALDSDLYEGLMSALDLLSGIKLPELISSDNSEDEDDDDDASLSIYRRSAAFLELPELCRFRNDLDRVISARLVSSVAPVFSA